MSIQHLISTKNLKLALFFLLFIIGYFTGMSNMGINSATATSINSSEERRLLYHATDPDNEVIQRAYLMNEDNHTIVVAIEYKITDGAARAFSFIAVGKEESQKWSGTSQVPTEKAKGVAYISRSYIGTKHDLSSHSLIFRVSKRLPDYRFPMLNFKSSPVPYQKTWKKRKQDD